MGRSVRWIVAGTSMLALAGCVGREAPQTDTQKSATLINYGTWTPWFYSSVLAVHAALMPPKNASTPAKVVYFGGSEFEPTLQNWVYSPGPPPPVPPPPGLLGPVSRNAWEEFDTGTGTMTRLNVPIPGPAQNPPDDFFCSAHTHAADGSLIIVGGNQYYPGVGTAAGMMPADAGGDQVYCPFPTLMNTHRCSIHFTGTRSSFKFDFTTNTLARGAFTAAGRWYPTVVRAYHGTTETFVALSGHPAYDDEAGAHPHHHTPWIEVASATTPFGSWQRNPTDLMTTEMYPRAFFTKVSGSAQGKIVVASPRLDPANLFGIKKSTTLTPAAANQFSVADLPNADIANGNYHNFFTSAVLLPLRPTAAGVYPAGRIMMTNDTVPIILDLNSSNPSWQTVHSVPKLRSHANATILATGDVMVSGGVNQIPVPLVPFHDGYDGRPDHSVYDIDIFRDDKWAAPYLVNPWHVGAPSTIARNYHHVALLLPNGTVLTAGGNKGALYSRTGQPPPSVEGRILRTELFIPWYAHPSVTRPTINKTATLNPPRSGNWVISFTSARTITRVALIAPGSVTHAFNVSQRYVELWKNSQTSSTVTVTVPGDQAVLPSGWYMLVISHDSATTVGGPKNPAGDHIPSESHWVKVP